jgi:tRNA-dihydrouridine synthase B
MRIARKHLGWYSKGLPASGEFRATVNRIDEPATVIETIRRFYTPLLERLAA